MERLHKKTCVVCGEATEEFVDRKLADGDLCAVCGGKLSPLLAKQRCFTAEEIRSHLAYREENAKRISDFHTDRIFGTEEKIAVDQTARQFIITREEDCTAENPDILAMEQVISCTKYVEEKREELFFTDEAGQVKPYIPPRYGTSYAFFIKLKLDSPWFDEITADMNRGERPDSKASDLYLEQDMEFSELVSLLSLCLHEKMLRNCQLGPDVRTINLRKQAIPMNGFGMMPKEDEHQPEDGWKCSCGTVNTRNFCTECGKRKESPAT